MTVEVEIAALKGRLAIAESERDAWRAAGWMENYLAACSMVDSLALRLERLEATPRDADAVLVQPTESELVLMGALGIRRVDGVYCWGEYRYERLADALAYAKRVLTG